MVDHPQIHLHSYFDELVNSVGSETGLKFTSLDTEYRSTATRWFFSAGPDFAIHVAFNGHPPLTEDILNPSQNSEETLRDDIRDKISILSNAVMRSSFHGTI